MALNITKGIQKKPIKAVIYGPPGVGKTTLGAGLPKPLFLDAEDGTAQLDVARISISDAPGLRAAVAELRKNRQGFETLVIDTGDWVETLITEEVLTAQKVKNIEDIGYGKGWVYLKETWVRFLADLDAVAETGMHVVVLAHSITKKVAPPGTPAAYDTYVLKLNEQNGERLKEWASMILFLNYDVQVTKGKDGRMRGVGGDERVMFTQPSASYIAKNRFGLEPCLTADAAHLLPIFAGKVTAPATATTQPAETQQTPPPVSITAQQLELIQNYRKTPCTVIAKALEHYGQIDIEMLNADQAALVIKRCGEEFDRVHGTKPANTAPDTQAAPAYPWGKLLPWLEANEAAINAALVGWKWLTPGQTFRDLPPNQCDTVKTRVAYVARTIGIAAPAA